MTRARAITLIVAALGVTGIAMAGQALFAIRQTDQDNRRIAALLAGQDVKVLPDEAARLQAARSVFLLSHGRPEDAQAIADRMTEGDQTAVRGDMLYNLGNFMFRRGLSIYFTHPMRETAPLLRIAQAEYRAALHEDAGNWDARYNLDIVDALVRDEGPASPTAGSQMAPEKALVPDEPGAPNGLP